MTRSSLLSEAAHLSCEQLSGEARSDSEPPSAFPQFPPTGVTFCLMDQCSQAPDSLSHFTNEETEGQRGRVMAFVFSICRVLETLRGIEQVLCK